MVTVPPCLWLAVLGGALPAGDDPDATDALAEVEAVADGLAGVVFLPLLPHAVAKRPAAATIAAPFMRLIVLAPHCLVAAGLRPDENGLRDWWSERGGTGR
jgi:hypothetical protein